MSPLPDSTHFWRELFTELSPREVGGLFAAAGWELVEPDDWDHVEVRCPAAELLIERGSTVLMHGPVADVATVTQCILPVLTRGGVFFTCEFYSPDGEPLGEWSSP